MGIGLPFRSPRVGSSPPPWVPGDAGTILYQLDAEASSVLWQDTSGTTPATTAGDPIQRWSASVGGNATQSTAGLIPVLALASGKKRVSFDGSNDRLVNASQTFTAGAKSLAFCWRYTAAPSGSEVDMVCSLGLPGTGGVSRLVFCAGSHPSAGLNWHFDAPASSTGVVGASSVTLDTSLHALVVVYNGGTITDAASYRAWLDGSALTIAGRASSLTPSGTTSIGAMSIGNNPATADVAHVLLWSGAISDANAIAACNYLLARHS